MRFRIALAAIVAATLFVCPAQATLNSTSNTVTYVGNGSTTAFTVPFKFLASTDLAVTVGGATKALNIDYTVRGVGNATGTVTFTPAPANAASVVITRRVDYTQKTSLAQNRTPDPRTVESALDKLAMGEQQLDTNIQTESAARAALATKEAADVAAAINPTPVMVNSNSLILATGSTTSRTLAARAADILNVKDYGAAGDGTTNDTAAFNAAIAAASNKILFVPPGTYILKNVTVAVSTRIECAGRLATTLKLPVEASLEGSPILNVTVANVTIRSCGFDGQRTSQPADGFSDSFNTGANGTGRAYRALVRVNNGSTEIAGFVIEDCLLQNAYGAGVATLDVSHVKARRNYANNNNFEAFLLYSDYAVGVYLKGHEVVDNEITNTASGDTTINGNAVVFTHASESIFANNTIDTVERNGLKCEFCANTIIRGNTINNVTLTGFGAIQGQGEAKNLIVSNNKITNSGSGINFGYFSPGTGYLNVLVSGNTVDLTTSGTTADGVNIDANTVASSGFTVVGNTFRQIARYCVYIKGALSEVNISNNTCKTTGAATGAGVLLAIDNTGSADYTVANNVINLGNVQTSQAGIYLTNSGGNTLANAVIVGNSVTTGTAHIGYADSGSNIIASGVFAGNITDGYASFASTGLYFAETNVIRSHNGWFAPSNGRTVLTTPVTVTNYDTRIIVNLTAPGAVAVNLPAAADPNAILAGHTLLIKDGKGDAAANNITITAGAGTTIDGAATKVINTNFGSVRLVFNGAAGGVWSSF